MAGFKEFAKNMSKRADLVAVNSTKAVRAVALAVDQQVVRSTPVDTGRARSNWIASINSPPPIVNREPLAGPGSAGPAIAEAQSIIGQFKEVDGSIWISNSVPYIGELNRGTSAQAPPNFVETAVIAGIAVIRRTKLLTRS